MWPSIRWRDINGFKIMCLVSIHIGGCGMKARRHLASDLICIT